MNAIVLRMCQTSCVYISMITSCMNCLRLKLPPLFFSQPKWLHRWYATYL